jgi:hypothetical protein
VTVWGCTPNTLPYNEITNTTSTGKAAYAFASYSGPGELVKEALEASCHVLGERMRAVPVRRAAGVLVGEWGHDGWNPGHGVGVLDHERSWRLRKVE